MTMSAATNADNLRRLLTAEQVVTDPAELQRSSVDNFRKLQNIFGVHTMRLPLAVVHVASTDEVSAVLKFADEHGVNVVARTGGTATEGAVEASKDMLQRGLEMKGPITLPGRVPLGMMGTPEDIAVACLYFASAASGQVTGQSLAVDGGFMVS